jgi:hypothetical protein
MTDDSDTIAVGKSSSAPMPPYTSFGSMKSALAVLSEHGVPNRIDRSVWGNKFSGSVLSQILTGFRFMRLIDTDGVPTNALRDLTAAYGKENWPPVLRGILQTSYGQLLDLDLQKATASQLYERFRTLYGADGDTGRKCVTFFLHAAQEAAIPVSNYLLTNAKPRAAGGASRRKPRAAARRDDEPETQRSAPADTSPSAAIMTDKLLAKFPEFDPSWPDEIKTKWFAAFNELMDRTKS